MRIVVDGNDGTGKSTLAEALRQRGYPVSDRGVPTRMTDDPTVTPVEGEVYLILDAPVEVCRARLARSGKDLTERYHTVPDLEHYRARFLEVAQRLEGSRSAVIDAGGSPEQVLELALRVIDRLCSKGAKECGCCSG
jgi:thymidylate kinase